MAQLEHFFERYILKNFLRSGARIKPELWSQPICEEMNNQTFVITTSSSEQIHSEIKKECCSSTRTLKNSISVLHRIMKRKEIDRRNFVESGLIRKRTNEEVYIRQAIVLGYMKNLSRLRAVSQDSSAYRSFQSNITNALTCIGSAKNKAKIVVKSGASNRAEWVILCIFTYVEVYV